jgi:Meckel syndrome type 1 protein
MTPNGDPWRTLGLAPGASADDVRRAYRRLAKANHPDAAGEGALPRFLAIQAAYELLAGPSLRRRPGARPGSRAAGSRADDDAREPWRADPDRARASGRADRRRPGSRPTGPGASGSARTAGDADQPGGARRAGGAGRAERGPAAGGSPGGSPGGSSGGSSSASSSGDAGRSRRSSGRRRAPNKRTPYSTSYDAADDEPFEPGWSGATWYGASSGTYWTINPKEYADPRKHGPEYQRRARRRSSGWILDDGDEPLAGQSDGVRPESPPDEPIAAAHSSDDFARAESTGAATGARAGSPSPSWTGARSATDARRPRPDRSDARGRAFAAGPPRTPSPPTPATRFTGPLLPVASTPTGRLVMALLGWPPIAVAIAAAIGEETGCGRFAASCGELSSPGTWIVEAAILLLLLALPAVARWSAHGTIATVVVGAPAALVLSAGGGSRQPEASSAALAVLLAVAYAVGVSYALVVPRLRARTISR